MVAPTYVPENWLPVAVHEYAELYDVSDLGRVRSHDRYIVERTTGKKRLHGGKIITPKRTGLYFGVSLFCEGRGKRFYLHRLVAEAFIPNPSNKPCVNHVNFDRSDNSAQNLAWVTYQENTAHSFNAGRIKPVSTSRGCEHHSSKLTDEDVKALRTTWKRKSSIKLLAQQYNVTPAAIYKILRGDSWKHVSPAVAIDW
jgi:hypothetical protein